MGGGRNNLVGLFENVIQWVEFSNSIIFNNIINNKYYIHKKTEKCMIIESNKSLWLQIGNYAIIN